jgi:hypothetical protein
VRVGGKASGYDRDALAEVVTSGYEPVIGDALRSLADRRRTAELASPLAP